MVELEAVLRVVKHIVLEVLIWVDSVHRVENELLSSLCLLRNETITRSM